MLHTNMRVWGPGPVIAGAVPKFNRPDTSCGLQEDENTGRFPSACNEE